MVSLEKSPPSGPKERPGFALDLSLNRVTEKRSVMNIPGFTAEVSLRTINDCYRSGVVPILNQESIFPAQFGEIPAPDGPDFPGGIPGLPNIPLLPLQRRESPARSPRQYLWCYYPCRPLCFFPHSWGGRMACIYRCEQECIWLPLPQ
jgi:hypothetical protein